MSSLRTSPNDANVDPLAQTRPEITLVRPADIDVTAAADASTAAAQAVAGAATPPDAATQAALGTPSMADGDLQAAQADGSAADAFAQFSQAVATLGIDLEDVLDASLATQGGAGAESGALASPAASAGAVAQPQPVQPAASSAIPAQPAASQAPTLVQPQSVATPSQPGTASAQPVTSAPSVTLGRPGSLIRPPLVPVASSPAASTAAPSSSAGKRGPGFTNLPSGGQQGGSNTPSTAAAGSTAASGAGAAGATGEAHTADGYTVSQVVSDMQKLQNNDKREGGPKRTAAQLRPIAEGIVAGVNNYFPASTYGSPTNMARTLVASAWKESKFDTTLGNGGVFQCAPNRLDDYNKAHGTHITSGQLSTSGNPAQSIDIALWALAHPNAGVIGRPVGNTPIPKDAANAAIYYWNYDGDYTAAGGGRPEIADYMDKMRYFEQLLG